MITAMKEYALITGASAGIGKAYAYEFARRGYSVVLVARREERLLEIQQDIQKTFGVDAVYYAADVSDVASRAGLIAAVRGRDLPISILVNNAGFGDVAAFEDSDLQKQLDMVSVNISALVHLTREMLPILRKTVGDIKFQRRRPAYVMNIGSVAGFQPGPYMATYYATKAFVLSFTEALAEECAASGGAVRACVVCPGPTQSDFGAVANFEQSKSLLSKTFASAKIPSADALAKYSVTAMFRGKRIIVHQFSYRALAILTRFFPRILTVKIVGALQSARIKT